MNPKKEIRKIAKEMRDNISLSEKREKEEKLLKNVTSLDLYKRANNILLYASFDSEADTWHLIGKCLSDPKKNLFLPRVEMNRIKFYLVESISSLKRGFKGIMEPDLKCKLIDDKVNHDKKTLLIAPGLAFDRHGGRIGYGKGYYDYFLDDFKGIRCGYCFNEQIFEKLETEETDQKMDLIISDEERIGIKEL